MVGIWAWADSSRDGFDLDAGLKLTKAYAYLSDVSDHKQVIPFRRFSGGVGRASQAKQFKATQGASLSLPGGETQGLKLGMMG